MKLLAIIALTAFLGLFFMSQAQAQQIPTKSFTEQSDPEAKKIIGRLQTKHKAIAASKVEYTLAIESGDVREVQQGKVYQKGSKFRIFNGSDEMVCDGKTVWMYIKKQNEVQITDFDPADEDMFSPNQIMDFSQVDKKFIYAITSEDAQAIYIEFKPNDKNAEYSKMRAKILKGKEELSQIKIFAKDGARYTLDIRKIESTNIPDTEFNFNKAQYPGVRETDLRD